MSSYCRLSSLWLVGASRRHAHFGARLYWMLKRYQKNTMARIQIRLLIFVALAYLVTYLGFLLVPGWHAELEQTLTSASALGILCLIPVFAASGWKSRKYFWDSIFQADFLMAFFLSAALVENFLILEHSVPTTTLALLCSSGLAWVVLRTFEARMFDKQYSLHLQFEDLEWPKDSGLLEETLFSERLLHFLGIFLVGAIGAIRYIVYGNSISTSSFIASLLPCSLPYSQWIFSSIIAEAHRRGVFARHICFFKNLKNFRLFVFHEHGILSDGETKLGDLWIDSDSDWDENEIKEILFRISEHSPHPICKLIRQHLPPLSERVLIESHEIRIVPHLGITADLRDLRGKRLNIVFGGLSWHKLLQNEIDSQGFEKLRSWQADRYMMSFLAINRKVVAAISFADQLRGDTSEVLLAQSGWLSRQKGHQVLISSHADRIALGIKQTFDECVFQALPVERDLQLRYWLEREPKTLEVKAAWDAPSRVQTALYFASKRSEIPEDASGVLRKGLGSLFWSLKASHLYSKAKTGTFVAALILTAGSSLIGNPAWILPFTFFLFITSLTTVTRFHQV